MLKVRHITVGRVRLQCAQLRGRGALASGLQRELAGLDPGFTVDVRSRTGSIIVAFDETRYGWQEISGLVRVQLSGHEVLQGEGRVPSPETADHEPEDAEECAGSCLTSHVTNALVLSGYLMFIGLRKVLGLRSLSSSPLSLTGLVTTLGALPMLAQTRKDWKEGRRLGLYPFLVGACGLALFTREAFTALNIVWSLSVGLTLEKYAERRSRRAVTGLMEVAPPRAVLVRKGIELEVPASELRAGDLVVVRSKERLPVDGVIVQGEALVDEAHLTGGLLPEHRMKNQEVFAGTRLVQGEIRVEVLQASDAVYLHRLLRMVDEGLRSTSMTERKADLLARRMVVIGSAATVSTLLLRHSLSSALAVMLVMACPCATVLAASSALSAAIGTSASRGVYIKGSGSLERVSQTDCLCCDKTGTVTSDRLLVAEVMVWSQELDANEVLALAAGLEIGNPHPVAKAVVDLAVSRNLKVPLLKDQTTVLGRGVRGNHAGREVLVGNAAFMRSYDILFSDAARRTRRLCMSGHTMAYVAVDGIMCGALALKAQIRPGAGDVLSWFRGHGTKTLHLISGDSQGALYQVNQALGFDELRGDLSPEDKAAYVRTLQHQGGKVLMVGDGLNDALALAVANVGVILGAVGSEVAMEAADVVLVGTNLQALVDLRRLSLKTMRIIEENFWAATITDLAGFTLGMSGRLNPLLGGMLHVVHTLGIFANSSRLMVWQPSSPFLY